MRLMTRLYGSGPRHLIAILIATVLAAYGWTRLVQNSQAEKTLLWLVAAVILHDFVLFPVYRGLYEAVRRAGRVTGEHRHTRVPGIIHLVVPTVLSGFLLLTWIPLILQPGESSSTYQSITGVDSDPFLGRWLLITAGLFVASALVFLVRSRTSGDIATADQAPHDVREDADAS